MKITVQNSHYFNKFDKNTPTFINKEKLNTIQKFFFYRKNHTITVSFYLMFLSVFLGAYSLISFYHPLNDMEFLIFNALFAANLFIFSIFFHEKLFISNLHRYHIKTHKYQTIFFTDKAKENIQNSYIMNYKTFIDYTLISYDIRPLIHTKGEPFFDDLKRTLMPTDKEVLFILEKPTMKETKSYIETLKKRNEKITFHKPFSFDKFSFEEKKEILFMIEDTDKKDLFFKTAMENLGEKEITKRLERYISFEEWRRR